ncbi:MAG: endonuclease III [Steroidobacteraceae bacterium]
MSPATIRKIFGALRTANPSPKTELEYGSPFQLLIAVILSAQATDKSVNLATRGLFAAAPDAAAMLKLGLDGIKQHVRTIGLFNSKAANVLATCETLIAQHGGAVPGEREALQALPGVGRKTANVVLNTAFGQPTMAVDTHIFRVARRIGLSGGDTVRAVEDDLVRVIPAEFAHDAHHWLILHGRYVCKARKPECPGCIIRRWCEFPDKTAAS